MREVPIIEERWIIYLGRQSEASPVMVMACGNACINPHHE